MSMGREDQAGRDKLFGLLSHSSLRGSEPCLDFAGLSCFGTCLCCPSDHKTLFSFFMQVLGEADRRLLAAKLSWLGALLQGLH